MAIELHDVTKTYADSDYPVLSDINMTVNDGEFFLLSSVPQGVGKVRS